MKFRSEFAAWWSKRWAPLSLVFVGAAILQVLGVPLPPDGGGGSFLLMALSVIFVGAVFTMFARGDI